MKKYKVLEAHQGDKFYKPGDPETGTRIADENAVDHLVKLGLLEEIGDAVIEQSTADDASESVANLKAQVLTLTQERDDARTDLAALGTIERAMQDAATALREQFETVTEERDSLKGQLVTVSDERDSLKGQLAAVTDERDAQGVRIVTLEGELAEKASSTSDTPAIEEGGTNSGTKPRSERKP